MRELNSERSPAVVWAFAVQMSQLFLDFSSPGLCSVQVVQSAVSHPDGRHECGPCNLLCLTRPPFDLHRSLLIIHRSPDSTQLWLAQSCFPVTPLRTGVLLIHLATHQPSLSAPPAL